MKFACWKSASVTGRGLAAAPGASLAPAGTSPMSGTGLSVVNPSRTAGYTDQGCRQPREPEVLP